MDNTQSIYYSIFLIFGLLFIVEGSNNNGDEWSDWQDAHATFYGDIKGGATMYGACGYENLFQQGYGLETAALSTALFNQGKACGSCYEIRCVNSQFCKKGAGSIKITATNFCPPWYSETPDAWCNPPRKHFDLAMAMFLKFAEYRAGIVPVQYKRVMCAKQGGIKFEMKKANQWWKLVLVYNVGGVGDVAAMSVKVSNSGWTQMGRNWGQTWQSFQNLNGQSLSFEVTMSNGEKKQFLDVVPGNWQVGQSFEAKGNM